MILVVSHNYLPVLPNSIYLESIDEKLRERAGFFKIPSDYVHLFAKALVADSLVPLSRVEEIVSCLSDISGELSLEKAEALLPEPLTQIMRYLRKFFWMNKPLYVIVPGLENISLIALLSLLHYDTKAEHIIIPYRQGYDSRIFEAVIRELEKKFTVYLTISKLTYQTAHLLSNTQEIWIGPDADLQAIMKLRFLQPAIERELELYKKIVVGSEGHYIIEDLDIEWIEKKPYRILVKEPSEIDYLSLVFGKDKVSRVAALLSELIKSSSLTEKNFFDLIRDLGLSLRDYYRLLKYGFIEVFNAPGGRNICPSLKAIRIYHIVELHAKKYVEEGGE